jgi:hypothetical protein
MMYEDSVEEQRYLSMIRREKASFEKLIHEKSVCKLVWITLCLTSSLEYVYSFAGQETAWYSK